MQALERVVFIPDWISFLILINFTLLVVLKQLNTERLSNNVKSIFNKGLLEIEVEEGSSVFNFFSVLFTIFSFLTFSLLLFVFINEFFWNQEYSFTKFLSVSVLFLGYMFGRFSIEYLLINLLELKLKLNFFFLSKRIFLYSISSFLLAFVALFIYNRFDKYLFLVIVLFLFFIRVLAIFRTNKNLIFSNLFYFILYICSFEIAPLLLLYKMITK